MCVFRTRENESGEEEVRGQELDFYFFAGEGWRSCARTFVLLSYRRKRSKGFALVNMRPGCAIVTGRVGARPPQPVR